VIGARIFFVGGLISYRALFGFLNPWIFVPSLLVAPIFQILLFVYIGRSAALESDEFYVIGNAVQYTAIPCLFAMTQTIAGERYQQTLGYILVTPAARLPLFLGRAVPVIVNSFFVGLFALFVGGAIVGIDLPASSYAPLAVVMAVAAYSCTGLGLVAAALGLIIRETSVLSNILFGLLLIFTGANVPLDALPDWMSTAAQAMPFTHAIEAARQLAAGSSLGDVSGLLGAELLIGAVYAVLGYSVLRWFEAQARLHATLERS
jgi:ABC-2 type transport system permease protein